MTWTPELNRERGLLIDKNILGELTPEESIRLSSLNLMLDKHLEPFDKLRLEGIQRICNKLGIPPELMDERTGPTSDN